MLATETETLLEAFTGPVLREHPDQFQTAWRRKNEQVHATGRQGGLLGNPHFQIMVCHEHLTEISQKLTGAIVRVVDETFGTVVEGDTSEQLKAYFCQKIGPVDSMMRSKISSAVATLGYTPTNPTYAEHFRNTIETAENEISLACARSVRRREERIIAIKQAIIMNGDINSVGGDAPGANLGRGNRVQNIQSFNAEGAASPELDALFEQLKVVVANLRPEMRVKDADVFDTHLQALETEAKVPVPDQHKLTVTGKGLIEAAKTVGEMAGPVIGVVAAILKLCGATQAS